MFKGFTHELSVNESKEWYTPKRIFDALKVQFDLDPCSPGADIVPWIPARKCYTLVDDGLTSPWAGHVWCNPPYGNDTAKWMAKCSRHGDAIALVFSRTDTAWFQDYCKNANLICFISARIQFIKADGSVGGQPGAGSMLIAWGEEMAAAVANSELGLLCKPMVK